MPPWPCEGSWSSRPGLGPSARAKGPAPAGPRSLDVSTPGTPTSTSSGNADSLAPPRSMSLSASPQSWPAFGSVRKTSRRRRSSAIWGCVNGRASAGKLSHRSSASWIRSAELRWPKSIAGLIMARILGPALLSDKNRGWLARPNVPSIEFHDQMISRNLAPPGTATTTSRRSMVASRPPYAWASARR